MYSVWPAGSWWSAVSCGDSERPWGTITGAVLPGERGSWVAYPSASFSVAPGGLLPPGTGVLPRRAEARSRRDSDVETHGQQVEWVAM